MFTSPEAAAFRARLLGAGLLVDSGTPGIYHRSFAFEEIVSGLNAIFTTAISEAAPTFRIRLSPVQPRATVEASGYVTSFPNLVGVVAGFSGGERQVPQILETVESGGDYTELLEPFDLSLCSAACHGAYPMLAGSSVDEGGLRFEVEAWCFRHEPSEDPSRLQTFRMHEVVLVGTPEQAIEHRDAWLERGTALLGELGLDVGVETANDPFFGRTGRLLAANQRAKALKFELVTPISAPTPGAVASANYHETHFGEAYRLTTSDGAVAHSACVGFGLDRLALALLLRHGVEIGHWPSDVASRLGL